MMKTAVVVVDESSVMRNLLGSVLSQSPELELLGVTHDERGLSHIAGAQNAQVLLVSSTMRGGTDWERVSRISRETSAAVILTCRDRAERTQLQLSCAAHGVSGVVCKPSSSADASIFLNGLRAALPAVRARKPQQLARDTGPLGSVSRVGPRNYAASLIVIGASTGGVEATTEILRDFPEDAPPTLLVQHIRDQFARPHAERLNQLSRCEVRVARSGETPVRGTVLLAPGDEHMTLTRVSGKLVVRTDQGPPIKQHRPSVDKLFESVARCGVLGAFGALLTGMGTDGAEGLLEMRRAGMYTLAQDERTSTVYGMPKAAVELGAVKQSLPLQEIASTLLRSN